MEQTVRSYNLAIKYLQDEKFEEAALFLEPLVKEHPSFFEAKWALGLLHVLSGFPHNAMKLWGTLPNLEDRNLVDYKSSVEEKLAQYDELYEKYNQALELVQDENFSQAKPIFQELLSFQYEYPLPVDFYHGYALALIVTREENRAFQEINSFPTYVKNHSVFREMVKDFTQRSVNKAIQKEENVFEEIPKKSLPRSFSVVAGMAACLLIGAIGMWAVGNTEKAEVAQPVIQQSAKQQTQEEEKSKSLEQELSVLKAEKKKVEEDLAAKNKQLSQNQQLDTIVSLAEVDRTDLTQRAGFNTYNDGMAAFSHKDYIKAAELLEKSLTVQLDEYYSDDALYYLIKSKQKMNKKDALLSLYDRFLSSPSLHFVSSPYKDDLMLGKAQYLLDLGRSNEALEILEKIRSDYKQEWTAEEALVMINQIKEGQND